MQYAAVAWNTSSGKNVLSLCTCKRMCVIRFRVNSLQNELAPVNSLHSCQFASPTRSRNFLLRLLKSTTFCRKFRKEIGNSMKNNTNINFARFIISFNSFWSSFKLCLLPWSSSLSSIQISSFKNYTELKNLQSCFTVEAVLTLKNSESYF